VYTRTQQHPDSAYRIGAGGHIGCAAETVDLGIRRSNGDFRGVRKICATKWSLQKKRRSSPASCLPCCRGTPFPRSALFLKPFWVMSLNCTTVLRSRDFSNHIPRLEVTFLRCRLLRLHPDFGWGIGPIQCSHRELNAVLCADFPHELSDVCLDRALLNSKFEGDFTIGTG
jgi:hypothetical protein